ncbi:MAG TPA: hypothetical protein VMS43_13865 [Allosphingosinicella sp.]|nr:hypothetical protein [Allosphingosinicella sp.]
MNTTPPEPPPDEPRYQYGSAEEDAWHEYMDGAGTRDPGGRRTRAINGCVNQFFVLLALFAIVAGISAYVRGSRPTVSETRQ